MKKTIVRFEWVAINSIDPNAGPAWHADVEFAAESFEEATQLGAMNLVRQMNMVNLADAGVSLSTIGAAINEQSLASLEQAREIIQGLTTEETPPVSPDPSPDDNSPPVKTWWQKALDWLGA